LPAIILFISAVFPVNIAVSFSDNGC